MIELLESNNTKYIRGWYDVVLKRHPVGKIAEKAVCRSVLALYFECRINKNALLQTVFWWFCPLGI